MNKLTKKTRDLETSHATDARHQRDLAHVKRFREAELDETIKSFFGGKEHPELALHIRFKMLPDTKNHDEGDAKFARHDSLRSKTTAGSSSGA